MIVQRLSCGVTAQFSARRLVVTLTRRQDVAEGHRGATEQTFEGRVHGRELPLRLAVNRSTSMVATGSGTP
jgi:hypothetical protein